MNRSIIVVLTFFFYSSLAEELYRLELLSQERGASCLDGTPPGIYVHEGTRNKNKFMIYFDSGGYCKGTSLNDTIQACYKRSSGGLGSTSVYKPTRDFSGEGVISQYESDNPIFFDWTKIYVIYCDGSEYLGHRQNPIQYKDKYLYFRGYKNVIETFLHLSQKYDFYNKETIVVTGVSSGGLAAFQWSNYLMQNTKTSKVLSIPDSGFFITDYYSPIEEQKVWRSYAHNMFNLVYQPEYVPDPIQKCMKNPQFDIVDCMNSGNYAQYLQAPTLLIISPYDQYSLDIILVAQCLFNSKPPYTIQFCNQTTRQAIEGYRQATLDYIQIFKKSIKNVGLWSPACVQHGFTDVPTLIDTNFQVDGKTINDAIKLFIENPGSPPWLIDDFKWPQNKGCNGMKGIRRFNRFSLEK